MPTGERRRVPPGLPESPWPVSPRLSRRTFLAGTGAASMAALLAACGSTPRPTPSASPSPSPSPSPTPTPIPAPTGYFDAIAELRDAVRGSPDHLVAEADRLVAAGDPAAILRFVRETIATYPAGFRNAGDVLLGRRWGTRATLRGGAGTPREKADLLAELYRRAGLDAEVVRIEAKIADPVSIFRAATRPPFEPAISPGRIELVRAVLGLPAAVTVPAPLDPGGTASARLADELLARFGTPPEAQEPFEARPVTALPMVRVARPGGDLLADPVGGGGLTAAGGQRLVAARDADDTLQVQITVEAARSDEPDRPFALVEGRWSADDLVGRRLFVGFIPPVESLEELVAIRPRDVSVVVPVLTVRGPDLDPEATRALSVRGTAVTLGGDLVDIDAEDGITRVGGEPVGSVTPDPALIAAIRSIEVTPDPVGFPSVGLGVRALGADGSRVEGLSAPAFQIVEEGTAVGFALSRTVAPPPRILILLDDSSSIPAEFRDAGAATVARRLAERLLGADPRARLRVAMVNVDKATPSGDWTSDPAEVERQATKRSGYGSQLWEALADAARLGPTAIVFVTDGEATDGSSPISAPPPALAARVRVGPPAIVIGVGKVDEAGLAALGAAGRLGAFPVTAQDEAVDAVVRALGEAPEPSYRFRYSAPLDGPTARRVEVRLTGTAVVGTATYEVPAEADRARPTSLSGLFLTVRVGRTEVRRVLAGVDADSATTPVTRLDAERVRRALFGTHVIGFEAAAPSLSVVLDDVFSSLLAMRPLLEARDRTSRLAALAAMPVIEPSTLHALSIPLPDGGDVLTYEAGLRATLHRHLEIPNADGRVSRLRAVDILPHDGFLSTAADPVEAFRTTARRTARLALMEAAAFPTSTLAALEGETLVPIGRSLSDALAGVDPSIRAAMIAAVAPWRRLRPLGLVPADGTPTAAWLFDPRSGSVYGVLADGTGGGSEVEEIEDTFDDAESLLSGARLLGNLASLLGLGGFSFAGGVWLQLELTKIQKLKAATLMLATLQPPEGDIADLSGLGCSLAQAAIFRGAGRLAGALAGVAGARAVTTVSLGNGATSMATGSGFFC